MSWRKYIKGWACTYKDCFIRNITLKNWTKKRIRNSKCHFLKLNGHSGLFIMSFNLCLICGAPFVAGLTDNTPSSTLASSQSGDASTWNSFQVKERILLECYSWVFFSSINYNLVCSGLDVRFCRHTRPPSTSRRTVAIGYHPPGSC